MSPNPRIEICSCMSPQPDAQSICATCKRHVDEVHITEEGLHNRSSEPKKPLYCIAYEEREGTTWKGHKLYVHADSVEDARLQYLYSEPPKRLRQRNVVGVARIIGYFVNDSKGENLSVD